MDSKSSTTLYIPVNIRTRTEFFSGFGVMELMVAIAVSAVATILSLLLYHLDVCGVGSAVFLVLLAIAVSVTVTIKDKNNICMVDHIGFIFAFYKAPKIYHYRYWEVFKQ